jgi:hypothetical protein
VDETCGSLNGSITIQGVTGGTPGYAYSLDGINFFSGNTFSSLAGGNYLVVVSDTNGCTYSEGITVNAQAGISSINISVGSSTCGLNNGSLTVTSVNGGTPGYQYSLDGLN